MECFQKLHEAREENTHTKGGQDPCRKLVETVSLLSPEGRGQPARKKIAQGTLANGPVRKNGGLEDVTLCRGGGCELKRDAGMTGPAPHERWSACFTGPVESSIGESGGKGAGTS